MTDLSKLLWRLERVQHHEGTLADEWRAEIMEQIVNHPEAEQRLDLAWVLADLAECYSELGRHDDAVMTARRSLQGNGRPNRHQRRVLGTVFVRAGKVDEAETLYAAVLAEDPDQIWTYWEIGTDYQEAGDHQRAIQWLEAGLERAFSIGSGPAALLFQSLTKSQTALLPAVEPRRNAVRQGSVSRRKRGA